MVELKIPLTYEMLVNLVKQLPKAQQKALISEVEQPLSQLDNGDEWITLLKSAVSSDIRPTSEYSDRREDWYGDDGR